MRASPGGNAVQGAGAEDCGNGQEPGWIGDGTDQITRIATCRLESERAMTGVPTNPTQGKTAARPTAAAEANARTRGNRPSLIDLPYTAWCYEVPQIPFPRPDADAARQPWTNASCDPKPSAAAERAYRSVAPGRAIPVSSTTMNSSRPGSASSWPMNR